MIEKKIFAFPAVLRIIVEALMVPVGYLMLLKHADGSYEHWLMAVLVTVSWLFLIKEMYRKTGE